MDDAPPQSAGDIGPWFKRNFNWLALGFALVFFVAPYVSPFETLNAYLGGPSKLSEWTLRKLEHLFKDYGYVVVFLGVLLENSMFLGLLVPGSIILILGGLAAQNGSINVWLVLSLAVAATILGDTLSYVVGRAGWTRAIERGSLKPAMDKFRATMHANSTWIILAYHFAGYSRAVGPAAAGLFRIPYRKWAPLDYAGGSIWALTYVMIGFLLGVLGVAFGDTKTMARLIELLFTGLLVAVILIAWYRASDAESRPEPGAHPAAVIVPAEEDRGSIS